MATCAVVNINSNTVVNMIMADPTDAAPHDTFLIEVPNNVICRSGFIWDGVKFIDNSPPAPVNPWVPPENTIIPMVDPISGNIIQVYWNGSEFINITPGT